MPYPQDPFALKIPAGYKCPSCKASPLIRETKDEKSPFLGQLRCQKCGFTSDPATMRKMQADERANA